MLGTSPPPPPSNAPPSPPSNETADAPGLQSPREEESCSPGTPVTVGEETPAPRPPTLRSTPIRLRGVGGYDGRSNDIVYCPPATHTLRNSAVVFFGGDVQDFPENMESHKDNKNYLRWNLESTAILLHSIFPESHIVVVRPSRSTTPKLATFMEFVSSEMDQNRMEFKTFSCYDNFVPCNNCGAPDHTPTHYALHHLERLLQGISSRIRSSPESELLVAEVQPHGVSSGADGSACPSCEEGKRRSGGPADIIAEDGVGEVGRREMSGHGGRRRRRPRARDRMKAGNESEGGNHEEDEEEEEEDEEDEEEEGASAEDEMPDDTGVSQDSGEGSQSMQPQRLTVENGSSGEESGAAGAGGSGGVSSEREQGGVSGGAGSGSGGRLWWRENINLDKADLTLVGFSKGCVVLNQFIYEFHYLKTLTPDDDTMMRLVTRIRDMFWLDGGHAGGKNTWITSRSLLETLTRLGIGVHIHVTPYQVQDERRPWIRKEEKAFGELLRRLGAPVSRTLHFESQPPTLCTHFDVLTAFRPPLLMQ
ncbi:mitochondrial protein C2orf69 isoform X2 [Ischnura elegans]|nr:mitochondrial protein C2orf69 isoform X2 [Ischnura elegans]